METFKTPKDIKIGTILVQHWLNSVSYYEVVRTTEKSVVVAEVPKKHIRFEHEGGGTGYNYVMPDTDKPRYSEEKRIFVKPAKDGGFYIPGVHRGSWCGNMHIWDGEEDSEYYN